MAGYAVYWTDIEFHLRLWYDSRIFFMMVFREGTLEPNLPQSEAKKSCYVIIYFFYFKFQ